METIPCNEADDFLAIAGGIVGRANDPTQAVLTAFYNATTHLNREVPDCEPPCVPELFNANFNLEAFTLNNENGVWTCIIGVELRGSIYCKVPPKEEKDNDWTS